MMNGCGFFVRSGIAAIGAHSCWPVWCRRIDLDQRFLVRGITSLYRLRTWYMCTLALNGSRRLLARGYREEVWTDP